MPIFEFICSECGENFEELMRSANTTGQVECPSCSSAQVRKKVSTFASKVAGGSSYAIGSSSVPASCSTGST